MGGGEGARKRGRPKGSTNRRARDLKGYIDATYGGSAAMQAAKFALVTPAELKAAGGSMARAQVAKAQDLVELVAAAQGDLDGRLREIVRGELEVLLLDVRDVTGKDLRQAVERALKAVTLGAGGFGLREALKILADERAALLPYTDQKQPLAIDIAGKGLAPSVVVMGQELAQLPDMPAENVQVFEGVFEEVSRAKSHEGQQALEFAGEPADPPAD